MKKTTISPEQQKIDQILAICRQIKESLEQRGFDTIEAVFVELDQLKADLHTVCAGKFVDICCICGHYTPDHPKEKCELKGLTCKWVWRGVQRAGEGECTIAKEYPHM